MTYKVTMKERQSDGSVRTLVQTACAPSEQAVVDWYGLNEPDIVEYKIEEVK